MWMYSIVNRCKSIYAQSFICAMISSCHVHPYLSAEALTCWIGSRYAGRLRAFCLPSSTVWWYMLAPAFRISNNQKSNGKYRVGIPGPYQVPTGMQMTSNDTWPWQQIARWQVCYSCSFTASMWISVQPIFVDPGFPPMGSWPNYIPAWRVHHSAFKRWKWRYPEKRILEAWPTGPHGQERDQGHQMGLWLLAVSLVQCFGWKWVIATHHLDTITHLKIRNHRTSLQAITWQEALQRVCFSLLRFLPWLTWVCLNWFWETNDGFYDLPILRTPYKQGLISKNCKEKMTQNKKCLHVAFNMACKNYLPRPGHTDYDLRLFVGHYCRPAEGSAFWVEPRHWGSLRHQAHVSLASLNTCSFGSRFPKKLRGVRFGDCRNQKWWFGKDSHWHVLLLEELKSNGIKFWASDVKTKMHCYESWYVFRAYISSSEPSSAMSWEWPIQQSCPQICVLFGKLSHRRGGLNASAWWSGRFRWSLVIHGNQKQVGKVNSLISTEKCFEGDSWDSCVIRQSCQECSAKCLEMLEPSLGSGWMRYALATLCI